VPVDRDGAVGVPYPYPKAEAGGGTGADHDVASGTRIGVPIGQRCRGSRETNPSGVRIRLTRPLIIRTAPRPNARSVALAASATCASTFLLIAKADPGMDRKAAVVGKRKDHWYRPVIRKSEVHCEAKEVDRAKRLRRRTEKKAAQQSASDAVRAAAGTDVCEGGRGGSAQARSGGRSGPSQ
jgi:hypothetical protein